MDLYVGIDGSGDATTYGTVFARSFVTGYYNTWAFGPKAYWRGPGMAGSETRSLVNGGREWALARIAELNRQKTPYRLFMCGYSRGGAAVTEIAFELKAKGIKVQALLLFDAVDMSLLNNVDTVPSNVKHCYHAMRNPDAGSREIFGNCATKAAGGVKFEKQTFWCTHGAMGGTPWPQGKHKGSDKIEEMTNAQKVGGLVGGGLIPGVGPILQREVHKNDYTNVTYDQEATNGVAAAKWMNARLAIARQDVTTS
jgi:hypothetical protein